MRALCCSLHRSTCAAHATVLDPYMHAVHAAPCGCVDCCYAMWCPNCASFGLRKQALHNDMTRYICCNGDCPCSGKACTSGGTELPPWICWSHLPITLQYTYPCRPLRRVVVPQLLPVHGGEAALLACQSQCSNQSADQAAIYIHIESRQAMPRSLSAGLLDLISNQC